MCWGRRKKQHFSFSKNWDSNLKSLSFSWSHVLKFFVNDKLPVCKDHWVQYSHSRCRDTECAWFCVINFLQIFFCSCYYTAYVEKKILLKKILWISCIEKKMKLNFWRQKNIDSAYVIEKMIKKYQWKFNVGF